MQHTCRRRSGRAKKQRNHRNPEPAEKNRRVFICARFGAKRHEWKIEPEQRARLAWRDACIRSRKLTVGSSIVSGLERSDMNGRLNLSSEPGLRGEMLASGAESLRWVLQS